jgi:para-nitrobenzyl esterase
MYISSRRKFLGQLSVITAAITLPKFASSSVQAEDGFVIAEVFEGKLKGIRKDGVCLFKGVPYAGSLSGDRRFKRPAKLERWTGVRDALQLGAPSIQPQFQSRAKNEPKPDEDCLFLNVWTPADDNKKRPVMFYNHGGGFSSGSGGALDQDGSNLARFFDVVVVETNHRLGLMGFLYLEDIAGPEYAGSGNNGLLDIVDGLKWVKKNIAAFGGDPDNVMIWGESGGGAKTSCLYAMPAAAPYFNKASIESGPGLRMLPKEAAMEMTKLVFRELNIDPKDWKKILDVPVKDLMDVQNKVPRLMADSDYIHKHGVVGFVPNNFEPVVDGVTLPHDPFDPFAPKISKDKPLMTGWNEDEWAFFAMYSRDTDELKNDFTFEALQAKFEPEFGADTKKIIETYRRTRPNASASDIWMAVKSINMMGLGTIAIAERKAEQHGAPVYLYNFDYKSEAKIPGTDYPFGTPHAMDITFKFNNEVPGAKPGFLSGNKPERFVASHHMAELWTTFARTGKPAARDVPEWPAYNLTDRPTMRIDTNCEVVNDRYKEELAMWRSIGRIGYHSLNSR